jgi:hypothetical protein
VVGGDSETGDGFGVGRHAGDKTSLDSFVASIPRREILATDVTPPNWAIVNSWSEVMLKLAIVV